MQYTNTVLCIHNYGSVIQREGYHSNSIELTSIGRAKKVSKATSRTKTAARK